VVGFPIAMIFRYFFVCRYRVGAACTRISFAGLLYALTLATCIFGREPTSDPLAQSLIEVANPPAERESGSLNGKLEFRAYAYRNDQVSVSIARAMPDGSFHSCWLTFAEPSEGYVMRAFDKSSSTVTLEYEDRIYRLALCRAQPSFTADEIDRMETDTIRASRALMAGEIGRERAHRWGPFGAEEP
jgi:hypothetical protein